MIKKIVCLSLVFVMLFAFAGCGEKVTLKCDKCGKDVSADADSNMTDEWIIYCEECEKELFSDGFVPEE